MGRTRAPVLSPRPVGRDGVLASLQAYVRDYPNGQPGLHLQGPPGIGLSTLMASAAGFAEDLNQRVIEVNGSAAESHVPFGALHQVMHSCRRIPAARHVLDLLSSDATRPSADRRPSIVEAAREVFDALPTDLPTLILIDNAHHLDPPSAKVLAPAIGERVVPRVGVVLGSHGGLMGWPALHSRQVRPLSGAAASRLLRQHGNGLDPWVVDRIRCDAAGRPLALIELPMAWREEHGVGADLLLAHSPLTHRLTESVLDPTARLSTSQRQLLLVAAASDRPWQSPELLAAAEAFIGSALPADIDALIDGGFLRAIGDCVGLVDPLLSAALVRTAPPGVRSAIGRALERVGEGRPPEDSCSGPQEVRHALAPFRAKQRGDVGTRSLLKGASIAADLGRFDVVATLLDEVPKSVNPVDDVRREMLDRRLDSELWQRAPLVEGVCAVADTCRAAGNPELGLELLAELVEVTSWWGLDRSARRQIWRSLRDFKHNYDDPRWLMVGAHVDPRRLEGSRRLALDGAELRGQYQAKAQHRFGQALWRLGRAGQAVVALGEAVTSLDRGERLGLLVPATVALADAQLLLGDWASAEANARKAAEAAERGTHRLWRAHTQATVAFIDALRGDAVEAREASTIAEVLLGDRPVWSIRARIAAARGVALMSTERYLEAYLEMEPALSDMSPTANPMDVALLGPLQAEAAHRAALPEGCSSVVAILQRALRANPNAVGDVHLQFVCALAASEAAGDAVREIVSATEGLPWLHARAQLTLGSALRRDHRTVEARDHLEKARATFASLGARPWYSQADQEFRATGIAEVPSDVLAGLLSPQELSVVRLAAEGLTNREIGSRMALSSRTVGSHLARAYPKLSVTSRYQLRARLNELVIP